MKIFFQPQPNQFPRQGGVATHLRQLYSHLEDKIEFVSNPDDADILHVESAYPIPKTNEKKPVIYICHGGFLPRPGLKVVYDNLKMADVIVSVSRWIAYRFFPQYQNKTIVIPNGVNLEDFQSQESEGYVLYAKEWDYYFNDVVYLAESNSKLNIYTTVWPGNPDNKPFNVKYLGLLSPESMKHVLERAGCLLLTGSEVCPTMLLEAWAAKVPVVSKGIDGSFEIFENHNFKGGMTYRDQNEMLGCVDLALFKRDEMGQEGYEIVKKHYQWKDLVNQYLRVYEKCLD